MKQTTEACGCCEGIEIVTPQSTANRPGLASLSYRIGTHATFLETMQARLSNLCLGSEEDCRKGTGKYPLQMLRTRSDDDPSIALLDAWATVADVLTFYNERIINEGYLRTATERRSVLELARLVGYKLRPGVAASVFLAYTLDDNFKGETTLSKDKDIRAQSVPGPGELPQTFEGSEDLKARAQWNNLKPRMTRPQTQESIKKGNGKNAQIYLKGISTNLKQNDPLLIDFTGKDNSPTFARVKEIKVDPTANRTLVILQLKAARAKDSDQIEDKGLIEELIKPQSVQPANSLKFERNLTDQFGLKDQFGNKKISSDNTSLISNTLTSGEASYAMLKAFSPTLGETLATAAANAEVTDKNPIKVYALRARTSLYGHNYPGYPITFQPTDAGSLIDFVSKLVGDTDNALEVSINQLMLSVNVQLPLSKLWPEDVLNAAGGKGLNKIIIDPPVDGLQNGEWVIIEYPELKESCQIGKSKIQSIYKIREMQEMTMSGQSPEGNVSISTGFTSKVNLLTLDKLWLEKEMIENDTDEFKQLECISLLRKTTVYAKSEALELAEEPIVASICGDEQEVIELDGFYEGLEAGRWVIISGERDIPGTSGIQFSEIAMLSVVIHSPTAISGDKLHTFIRLAKKLEYCFKRDTVKIYGNVVKATHGETRPEVLGSGDGAKTLQEFDLKQPPLTYVSASNPSGVDSTLKVFVNEVEWHEADTLSDLQSTNRNFITKTNNEGQTTIAFGNGKNGARLPTGTENIKARYRNGIGKSGNVKAGQISLLTARPLGAKDVINPLRASGGADKENRDQARKNAPLAVKALDRLVSVQDYEDFSRTFAGIGKARATELSDGRRQLVHVTIAGVDDIPIDKNSDLYRSLRQSLLDYGDLYQAIQLEVRELVLIVIDAKVRILPDYQWESVVTQLRSALLDAFSFERRELGQDVLLSEVLSVMQAVRGVVYVDIDQLGGIPEKIEKAGERLLLTPADIVNQVSQFSNGKKKRPEPRIKVNLAGRNIGEKMIHPAQLAFLTPEVPATLNLIQIA
jgi:hypothetical protein